MEIYSPDLANAEQELLFLKNNNEPGLMEAAERKLRLLGVSDQQINYVLRTGKVDYSIPVISPYSGFLAEVSTSTVPQSSSNTMTGSTSISSSGGSSMGSMGSVASSETTPSAPDVNAKTPVSLKEGQYISAGQKLFSLVSTEDVWAEFFVISELAQKVKRGSGIRIKSKDQQSKTQRASVSLVQPFYKEGTNYVLARASITNSNKAWRIGELIDVIVENTRQKGNWLPKTAVLSLGTRYVVFVKKEKSFVPVYVSVRNIASDAVDIGNSLNADTDVAENAWFLIDSESFIKPEKLP